MTINEARKIIGKNESKYSDEELGKVIEKMRKLAEIIYPKTLQKAQFSS